jgi:hypothetical protein
MSNMISGFVLLAIAVVIFANVFMYTVKNTNTTGWTSGETGLWSVLGIAGIAALVLAVLSVSGVL